MKTVLLLFSILLLSAHATSQTQTLSPELRYAIEKKEVGAALAYSILLPGGGHVYAQRSGLSAVFIVSEVGTVIWYIVAKNKAESNEIKDSRGRVIGHEEVSLTPLYILAIAKILDIFLAPASVSGFNRDLSERLQLRLGSRGIGLQIAL